MKIKLFIKNKEGNALEKEIFKKTIAKNQKSSLQTISKRSKLDTVLYCDPLLDYYSFSWNYLQSEQYSFQSYHYAS